MRVEEHLPLNHPARPFWRVLAFLSGAYILAFGVVGFIQSRGMETFAQPNQEQLPVALGLYANPAFAILSIVVGALVVLSTVIGRNVDYAVNFVAGSVFVLAGTAALLVLRTDLNYLGFSMTTSIVSSVLGVVMLTAALYGRVGTAEKEAVEKAERHGGAPD